MSLRWSFSKVVGVSGGVAVGVLLSAACGNSPAPEPPALATVQTEQRPAPHEPAAEAATCNHDPASAAPAPVMSAPARQLLRVADPSQVCMVRNHVMDRPQLSVQVQGATYFGCCDGCRSRLRDAPEARMAIDPVSHRPIDKALAVMAQNERGNVLYFENDNNLAAYQAGFD
jgi:YHS domain-containing protein